MTPYVLALFGVGFDVTVQMLTEVVRMVARFALSVNKVASEYVFNDLMKLLTCSMPCCSSLPTVARDFRSR